MTNDDTHPVDHAFVLAAGFGTRMRPLTDHVPKPLVMLDGKPLIDHVLDRIAAAGIANAVINVHYLADQIEQHVATRRAPRVRVSDERDALLDTGGGAVRALPLLGSEPFLTHNSDAVWIEPGASNIARLAAGFDSARMDSLLLLAPVDGCLGYDGRGDFSIGEDGRLERRIPGSRAPYVFAGVSILHPHTLRAQTERPFSLNNVWDRAITERRLYGIIIDGLWMHVGDPTALADAERAIADAKGRRT